MCRALPDKRDELAPIQLSELHPILTSQDRARQNIELAKISQRVRQPFCATRQPVALHIQGI
jgi:hypothetical protein